MGCWVESPKDLFCLSMALFRTDVYICYFSIWEYWYLLLWFDLFSLSIGLTCIGLYDEYTKCWLFSGNTCCFWFVFFEALGV